MDKALLSHGYFTKHCFQVFIFAFFAILGMVMMMPFSLHAQGGGEGSGGTAGSCSGVGYCAAYGVGWHKYDVKGDGPGSGGGRGFPRSASLNPDGVTWSGVKGVCAGAGTSHVWIYDVREAPGSSLRMGFNYTPSLEADGTYDGEVTTAQAKGYYDDMRTLGLAGNGNFSWGSNIGWFCYVDSDWSSEGASTADRSTARPGDKITWTHTLKNKGPTKSSEITGYVDVSGFPGGGLNGKKAETKATLKKDETRSYELDGVTTYVVSFADLNRTLCQQLHWNPSSSEKPAKKKEATSACVTIVNSPTVQVMGGDLIVGRGSVSNPAPAGGSKVVTSSPLLDAGKYYGSWAEYGIVPSGVILGMASGSGYAGGSATGNDFCRSSVLSFVNTNGTSCNPSSIGKYTGSTTAPDVASRFRTSASTPTLPATTVDITAQNLSGLYRTTAGAVSIRSSGQIPAGRSVIINAPNTDVTIASNIVYSTGSLANVGQIPQVVIIARSISIANTTYSGQPLTNVDAWLVAVGTGNAGYVNTCASVSPGAPTNATLNANTCNNRLTVNGPIVTNKLYLYRTAGVGSSSNAGDPAEVFNLRADAYVWGTSYSAGTGRIPTVSTKELPPRF